MTMNNKAQGNMAMPIKMIFAIFLIVVFVAFAFMAVSGVIDTGDTATVGFFYDDLQDTVDDALSSQSTEKTFEIDLPSGITTVCFANLSDTITNTGEYYDQIKNYEVYIANVFLIPPEEAQGMQWKYIDNIDIEAITAESNPYCVSVKQDLTISKDFYSKLVTIQ